MPWNWQLPAWPRFKYDQNALRQRERQFLLGAGNARAFLKNIGESDYNRFVVEILSEEGLESARIEGEILDRESLQSSIKRHFGLIPIPENKDIFQLRQSCRDSIDRKLVSINSIQTNLRSSNRGAFTRSNMSLFSGIGINPPKKRETKKESAMADLLCDVYESFDKPLTREMLWKWHQRLFHDQSHIDDRGKYRTHTEPMQIVSGKYGSEKVFFEAPPSKKLSSEMKLYTDWFNRAAASEPILGRAAIAHVYFESIHPFEDGNGRIGRILVEKVLSQGVGRPTLIAVSKILETRKKEYYSALEKCNRTLKVDEWVDFFCDAILQAQEESMRLLHFLIEKSKMLTKLSGKLNARQEKVVLRLFEEGPTGFKGGLSAEIYIAITKTSRATATRDLIDLVESGVLIKTGELRHTRYWLKIN